MSKVKNHTRTKKSKKLKILNIILTILLVISICALIYYSYKIFSYHKDTKAMEKIKDELEETVDIKEVQEVEEDENVQVVEQEEDIKKDNPYYDYIKMNLIDVDIKELKEKNSDTVGWIQVNGTNINYPFVQTKDNKYYLTHDLNKNYNSAGWVFLDYRNNIKKLDKNTIIYAHARLNKTMFGSLKNILKSDWYKNKNNYVVKLSTENQNTLWQVFSVYHIPETSDYIQVKFSSDTEFKTFVDKLQKRSVYKFDTTVSGSDKILTLSTCYGETERMVMHAKLIKYSNK